LRAEGGIAQTRTPVVPEISALAAGTAITAVTKSLTTPVTGATGTAIGPWPCTALAWAAIAPAGRRDGV
jgi:hypothetical protein